MSKQYDLTDTQHKMVLDPTYAKDNNVPTLVYAKFSQEQYEEVIETWESSATKDDGIKALDKLITRFNLDNIVNVEDGLGFGFVRKGEYSLQQALQLVNLPTREQAYQDYVKDTL